MKIQYRSGSDRDIEQTFDYIKKRSPTGALNVLHAILDGVERIADNPYAWQVTDDPNPGLCRAALSLQDILYDQ